ncbi:MAG: cytidylate kinase-like family protein [Candidatus Thermoplasmatota archaeon]
MVVKRHKDVHEMIEERIREWESGKSRFSTKDLTRKSKTTLTGLVVTISREAGCNGHAVAEILSAKLGLALYDRKIVELIAKDKNISTRVVSTLDEQGHSELRDWIDETMMGSKLSTFSYFQSLKRVLFTIVKHGNAVIVGRGGNLLVPHEKRIAIRLVAPIETKVKNVMEQTGCTEKKARTSITRIEEERRQFVRKYMEKNIDDPTLNDVVINMASVRPKAIAQIVKDIYENSDRM